jgi:hypothetical protein
MIKVGDQVVCIDDRFDARSEEIIPNRPCKDSIYTVRDIVFYNMHDKMGVLLHEIHNPKNVRGLLGATLEPSFNIIRFAPLDDVLESITLEEFETEPA